MFATRCRFLKTIKALLYSSFGLIITVGSAVALISQFHEQPEFDTVPDLFVGLDCDIKPLLIIEPEIEGLDTISLHYPLVNQPKDSNGNRHLNQECTRAVFFSHEKLENFGSDEVNIPKVVLSGIKQEIYVARVDLCDD